MKIINNILNGMLVICMFLVIGVVVLTVIRTSANDPQSVIKQLNKDYVFVYPYPQDLPEGVNLCVDVIEPGTDRDTIYLMPDHESAGY